MTHLEAFAVLGLTTNASIEQVEARYRDLAKQFHPDRHTKKDAKHQRACANKFIEAKEAYEEAMRFLKAREGQSGRSTGTSGEPFAYSRKQPHPAKSSDKPAWSQLSVGVSVCSAIVTLLILNHSTQTAQADAKDKVQQANAYVLIPPKTPTSYGYQEELWQAVVKANRLLDQQDYKLALSTLAAWKDIESRPHSVFNTNVWRDFLSTLHRAQAKKAEDVKSDPLSYSSALFARAKTLHRAMKHNFADGSHSSAHRLKELAATTYSEAVDVVSPLLEPDCVDQKAVRLAVVVLESHGALLVEYGQYTNSFNAAKEAQTYLDRSAELCRMYPDVAHIIF